MARQEAITGYAASRAKLLLGCYRTGEANDPETYVAAITAILSRYPEEVITEVTHPVTGMPAKKGWLPTVKEVVEACDDAVEPIIQREAREKRIKEQLEEREKEDAIQRPTIEDLHKKYGKNWGLKTIETEKTVEQKAEESRAAMEREQMRVRQQYDEASIKYPGKLALSMEARRLILQQDQNCKNDQEVA